MIKLGKMRAGLFCGSKVFSLDSWRVEGFKLRVGKVNYRVRGEENTFLLGVGPFIIWESCRHERHRCVHASEMNRTERRWGQHYEVARVACADCNLYIYGVKRPYVCTDTGFTHSLTRL